MVWLHIGKIQTDDFDSVRSAIMPDLEALFASAEQEFARGYSDYTWRDGRHSPEEKYNVSNLMIVRHKGDNGSTYDVLWAFTSQVRIAAGGFFYSPSDERPTYAPLYGVICSKHLEGHWYGFNTIPSDIPSKQRDCPEDTQYH